MCRDRQELPLKPDELGREDGPWYGVRPIQPIQPSPIGEEGALERRVNEGSGPDSREYSEGDSPNPGYDLKGSGAGWVTGWGWND